jgi:hypothetical protein
MATGAISEIVTNYIHEGKQFSEDGTSAVLTAGRIGRVTTGGALDFGGSEYAQARVSWLEPQKQSPDDKYGWWKLSQGEYRLELNESVSLPGDGSKRVLFHPWSEAAKAGLSHPSEVISASRSPIVTHLTVGPQGLSIKENARVSQVTVIS